MVPRKLDPLTGLRFFAAAAIVYVHYEGALGIPRITGSFSLGQGVSYFFVLSGFVLAYTYPALPSWQARRNFMVARFARIWPAYAAAIALTLFLLPIPVLYNTNLAVNLLMVEMWWPVADAFQPINGPSWSISTEFGLYAAFMLSIGGFEKNWVRVLLIAAFVTGSLIAVALFLDLPWSTSTLHSVTVQSLIYQFPLGRLFEFVAGMCMALLFRHRPLPAGIGPIGMTVIEFSVVGLIVLYAGAVQILCRDWPNAVTMYFSISAALPASLAVYVFAQQRGVVSNFLGSSPVVLLGELSYAMYLLHVPVGRYFFENRNPTTFPDTTLALCLLCVLGLSYMSWALLEIPARAAIRRALVISSGSRALAWRPSQAL